MTYGLRAAQSPTTHQRTLRTLWPRCFSGSIQLGTLRPRDRELILGCLSVLYSAILREAKCTPGCRFTGAVEQKDTSGLATSGLAPDGLPVKRPEPRCLLPPDTRFAPCRSSIIQRHSRRWRLSGLIPRGAKYLAHAGGFLFDVVTARQWMGRRPISF